jgi:hypothetical protein
MEFNSLYSEIDESVDIEENVNENFTQMLSIIKQDLTARKYKKVYQDIEFISDGHYNGLKQYWKLREYKLESILKIVSRRLFGYYAGSKKGYPLLFLDNWFKTAGETLEDWGEGIDNADQDEIDSYIFYTLWEIYLHSLHLRYQNRYFEVTALLSIGEALVKVHSNSCRTPRTLNICQRILLFVSSLLIADGCFETAKSYQYRTMQLLIKELFYSTDSEDRFVETINTGAIINVFTTYSIACYQRGVCEENLGHLDRAIESYRQSSWSAKKFLKNKVPEFVQFIHFLEEKACKYFQLTRTLIDESIRREQQKKKGKKEIKKIGRDLGEDRFNKIKEEVEKVITMIPEDVIGDETPKKYITSTVELLEKLLSPEYRQIVKNANDVKIFKMDKEFKEKFKKRMSQIRVARLFNKRAKELFISRKDLPSLPEIYSLMKINNEKTKDSEPIFLNTEVTSSSKTKSAVKKPEMKGRAVSALTGDTEYTQTHPRLLFTEESQKQKPVTKQYKSSNTVGLFILDKKLPKATVQPITPDNFVFSNQFKKKIDYLSGIEKKELAFQKKLLSLKRCEKLPYDIRDEKDIKQDVEGFFRNTVRNKIKNSMEEEPEEVTTVVTKARRARHKKLERTIIQSLDPKKLEEFIRFLRKRDSQAILSDEFLPKLPPHDKTKDIDKIKNHIVNDLNKKLGLIELKRQSCLKVINPSKYKAPVYTSRRSVTENDKPKRTMDEFVKTQAVLCNPSNRRVSLFGSVKKNNNLM